LLAFVIASDTLNRLGVTLHPFQPSLHHLLHFHHLHLPLDHHRSHHHPLRHIRAVIEVAVTVGVDTIAELDGALVLVVTD
jgi:hypothetical protein